MFGSSNDEMKVCHNDGTPLIFTFKFPGAEYWCPCCGYRSGMLGAGKNVPVTFALKREKVKWRNKAKPYLTGETDEREYQD